MDIEMTVDVTATGPAVLTMTVSAAGGAPSLDGLLEVLRRIARQLPDARVNIDLTGPGFGLAPLFLLALDEHRRRDELVARALRD